MEKERKAVNPVGGWSCTICGEKMNGSQKSFAVAQDPIEDKVRIFHRGDAADACGIHGACCSIHVRELVIHWMVTGSLDYPFADAGSRRMAAVESLAHPIGGDSGFGNAVPIGELAIDRDSVNRVLSENPAWLEVILDELHSALERSVEAGPAAMTLADLPAIFVHHT